MSGKTFWRKVILCENSRFSVKLMKTKNKLPERISAFFSASCSFFATSAASFASLASFSAATLACSLSILACF